MPSATVAHKFQAPKGTRDFYPDDMAVRRRLERVWRDVSIDHGFDEVDGPTFEHLELYTAKSGPGIVSELFSFRRAGGETDYALRPEFTPTLARMVAARAGELSRPIRWFTIPSMFRAERPQRGRLREHIQWNVDIVGDPSARADAEVIAACAGVLERLGLTPNDVSVRLSHRETVKRLLLEIGLAEERLPAAFDLLDRRAKLPADEFDRRSAELGLDRDRRERFDHLAREPLPAESFERLARDAGVESDVLLALREIREILGHMGLAEWITFDLSIVRGLAYYTGTVFEVHETSGRERAVAGGGRYDHLVELFGGPPTPAVGVAMGDVVIRLLLEERGLLEPAAAYMPHPDVFVVNALGDAAEGTLLRLVSDLRRAGLHVRRSYRATRNVGKLLGEASKAGARRAVILGTELETGRVSIKDLESGAQLEVALAEVVAGLRGAPAEPERT